MILSLFYFRYGYEHHNFYLAMVTLASYVSCERKESVDIYRNKGYKIGEELARNYVLVKFLLFIVWLPSGFRFPLSSSVYFREVSENTARCFDSGPAVSTDGAPFLFRIALGRPPTRHPGFRTGSCWGRGKGQ